MNLTLQLTHRQVATLRAATPLSYVFLRPDRSGVRLSATGDHSVHIVALGKIEGTARMELADLAEAVRCAPEGFMVTDGIAHARGWSKPMMVTPCEYTVPALPRTIRLRLPDEAATTMLARVLPAMGSDDTRPALAALNFERKGGVLTIEATDGHRLHVAQAPSKGRDFDVVIPAKAAKLLARLLGELVLRATSAERAKQAVSIRRGRHRIDTADSFDMAYFDRAKVLPTTCSWEVKVDAEEFRDAVKYLAARGSRSGGTKSPVIRMAFGGRGSLLVKGADGKDIARPIAATSLPMEVGIAAQSHYLLSAVGKTGEVTICFDGDMDPIRIDHDGVTCVVMPCRM